jgi:hypothetical protein
VRAATLLTVLLAACGQGDDRPPVPEPSGPPVAQQVGPRAEPLPSEGEVGWNASVSDGRVALHLLAADATPILALSCTAGRLRAQVTGFTRIGSEDRLTLAVGEEPVALAADLKSGASGVVGEGAVPERWEELVEKAESVGAVYGRQQSGPHPAPPEALKRQLVEACELK